MKVIFSRFKSSLELFIIIPIITILLVIIIYLFNENFENNKNTYYNVYHNDELVETIGANHLPINLDTYTHINHTYYCRTNLVYRGIK